MFVCFTSHVNSNGHGGKVGSPNHTFFLGKLEQAFNQYLVHILSLVTDLDIHSQFTGFQDLFNMILENQYLFLVKMASKSKPIRKSILRSMLCSEPQSSNKS